MGPSLSVLDLFAGAGGLSFGFDSTKRFSTVMAVEQNLDAAQSFGANHPDAQVWNGDIAEWLRIGHVPKADVVVGGPPCQGFSNLGKRRHRDPRNALWRRYVETLARVRPQAFVMENVADFLGSGQWRDLRRETHRGGLLYDYRVEGTVLNAADYGAAQLRRRAVVIGTHKDFPSIGHPPALKQDASEYRSVRDAIGALPAVVSGIDLPPRRVDVWNGKTQGPFRSDELHLGRRPSSVSLERYRHIPPGGNRKSLPDHLLAPCWREHQSGSGDVMGRLRWDHPSVTIRTEFWKPEKGRYLHPVAHRPITHLEACRLQGFPDHYLWFGSKTEIGRQIGNAVPFELAVAIANHLADGLGRPKETFARPRDALLIGV